MQGPYFRFFKGEVKVSCESPRCWLPSAQNHSSVKGAHPGGACSEHLQMPLASNLKQSTELYN